MEAIAKKWSPEATFDTPYQRARQEWDARIGSSVVQAKSWRLATFASLGSVFASLVGLIYLGSQPKVVPHIIQIDQLGAATYRGPVGQTGAEYTPSDAVLKYHLRRFVEDTRSITSDAALLKRNWLEAYGLTTPNGANMLSAFVQKPENEPFRRAQQERVTVDVVGMVRVSADTWQIDWKESRWDKNGNPTGAAAVWRGMFRIVMQTPKTEEQMARNPLGLFVEEFHWDKVQG